MKKVVWLLACCLLGLFATAKSYLIFSTSLDGEIPENNLSSAPLDPNHDYYIYLIQDVAFNTDVVYFEVSAYRKNVGKFVPVTIFNVDVDPKKGYCWQTASFNIPM